MPALVVWCSREVVSRWPQRRRVSCGGCSRVEHRLVGAVHLVPAHQYWPSRSSGVVVDRGRWGWSAPGTLLGPEGSGASSDSFMTVTATGGRRLVSTMARVPGGGVWSGPGPGHTAPRDERGCGCQVGSGRRLYVENYTVDASIFVAKFLRAHGGCLGTRNRRRT